MIDIQNIDFSYTKEPFIKNVSTHFEEGKITSIIGANGSGKSTLLMLICRVLHVQKGHIQVQQKDSASYSKKAFARYVAVVHQKNTMNYDVEVETIVGYGRLPYMNYYQSLSQEDMEIIEWVMQVTGLTHLRNHRLKTLSGGQQQRVWIAMALAQRTPILLLDEPTTYLDIKYQLEILQLIKKINEELHMTIVMVHHDINQALHYSHYIKAMKEGEILFEGKADDVISETSLQQLYDCKFKIIEHENEKIVRNV